VSDDAPIKLDRFELVLLKRPEGASALGDDELERIHRAHLGYLGEMHAAGHMRTAGPLDEQADEALRGMCLYQTGSLEVARDLANADPAVRAGRLEVDAMYWYCPAGEL
jgi:uncharacterized protein YciI